MKKKTDASVKSAILIDFSETPGIKSEIAIIPPNNKALAPINSDAFLEATKNDIPEDYNTARDTLRDLVDKGTDAVKDALDFAQESGHPRAFEVLSNLMKIVGELSEKLLNVHKTTQEIRNLKNNEDDENHNEKQPTIIVDQRPGPQYNMSTKDMIALVREDIEKNKTITINK